VFGRLPVARRIWEPRISGGACRTIDAGPDAVAGFEEADALRPRADGDALTFEDVAHGGADILVLPGDQPRPLLDDRHVRTEAAEHLGEFQPDIAAADDDEVFRHLAELHHRDIVEIGHVPDTGEVGHDSPSADIEEDLSGGQ
jgi:hypothetical protein